LPSVEGLMTHVDKLKGDAKGAPKCGGAIVAGAGEGGAAVIANSAVACH
jgi:hypothetical protein